ncbi:MAG: DEAD/DEAH box helicase [Halobacteriaceae archaeon]
MEVAEVLPEFADAFPFEEFNQMQREALPAVLETDENVVASAPTASGKTALAELAICRAIADGGTALFLAPLRALTNEKESEWERFEDLGHSVYVVTGERDLNPRRAARADVLVMTPEKADSATRKHDSPRYEFVTDVDVCIIDEVHLLDSGSRGSVLEVTVSRLRRLCDPRVVALSATMRNVEDVAEWLDAPPSATFAFGEEYRPVDLEAGVRTYAHGENSFADKYRRLYTALDLAEPHLRDDGQALVFVSSRSDTVEAAETARDELAERDLSIGARGDYEFHTDTEVLDNDTLRQSVLDGVAFHHAGLSTADKNHVERWFKAGTIELLFSTSTLAWGVNLPARCVVIRDTKLHDPLEGEVEMSPLDVLQMCGRAGRPGYDDEGFAWVVCDAEDADRYRELLREGVDIESQLAGGPGEAPDPGADPLAEHLNAEIAMGTVDDLGDVMDWLETTFYYVRAQSSPEAYDFGGLRDRVRATVESLVDRGFAETDDLGLDPTRLGELTSRYYLRLDTAEQFHAVATRDPRPGDDALLRAVARAGEFDSVSARRDEREAIRAAAPDADDLAPGARKVLAILRASAADSVPGALASDAWVIRQNALRLLGSLRAFLDGFADGVAANRARRLAARVDHGASPEAVGLTAVDGVGAARAATLADAGITSPGAVREAGPGRLAETGLEQGVAERVYESAASVPALSVGLGDLPDRIARGENAFGEVRVTNDGAGGRVAVRLSVNGVEMTTTETFVAAGESTTVPAPVHGADAASLHLEAVAATPELPLAPVTADCEVTVE